MNKIAVRAFNTLYNRTMKQMSENARMDALFDAGEFSGRFHAQAMRNRYNEQLWHVAERFGMSAEQLESDWMNFTRLPESGAMYAAGYAYASGYHD